MKNKTFLLVTRFFLKSIKTQDCEKQLLYFNYSVPLLISQHLSVQISFKKNGLVPKSMMNFGNLLQCTSMCISYTKPHFRLWDQVKVSLKNHNFLLVRSVLKLLTILYFLFSTVILCLSENPLKYINFHISSL